MENGKLIIGILCKNGTMGGGGYSKECMNNGMLQGGNEGEGGLVKECLKDACKIQDLL